MSNLHRLLYLLFSLTLASCTASSYPITIHTEPAGAQLKQNGHLLGQSPLTIDYPKHNLRQGRLTLKVDVQWPSGAIKKQTLIDVSPKQSSNEITIQRPNLPGRTVDEDYGKIYLALRTQQHRSESSQSMVVMTSQSSDFIVNCNKVGESPNHQGLNCTYSCLGEVVTETIHNPMTCPNFIQRAP